MFLPGALLDAVEGLSTLGTRASIVRSIENIGIYSVFGTCQLRNGVFA